MNLVINGGVLDYPEKIRKYTIKIQREATSKGVLMIAVFLELIEDGSNLKLGS